MLNTIEILVLNLEANVLFIYISETITRMFYMVL
jgi:hypothetical protein